MEAEQQALEDSTDKINLFLHAYQLQCWAK